MERAKAHHPVRALCRVLGVSPSGSDAWRTRGPAVRARGDERLATQVAAIHRARRGLDGAPRLQAERAAAGTTCGRKRGARLMRRAGLRGGHRRRAFRTTRRDPAVEPAPDLGLVQRACAASAPDRLGVADITSVPTADGFLSLAVVRDVFSRRVVGWSMADPRRAEVAVDALRMALSRRQPAADLIHHSDHGSHYTAAACAACCCAADIRRSMGSVGDCFDNALAESFFAPLECELLMIETFRTHVQARTALFASIEGFYNRRRRHSALGSLAPDAYERRYTQQQAIA